MCCQMWVLSLRGCDRNVLFLWSYKHIFSQKWYLPTSQHISPSISGQNAAEQDGIRQHGDASLSRKSGGVAETKTGDQPCAWHSRVAQQTPAHSTRLSGASHPSSQSIHHTPTVILFVQINNEKAAATHGGTQRVVIAAFVTGSDGLCGRLARLHCDLVCVCNFPQA